jgi:hypothetical protein
MSLHQKGSGRVPICTRKGFAQEREEFFPVCKAEAPKIATGSQIEAFCKNGLARKLLTMKWLEQILI